MYLSPSEVYDDASRGHVRAQSKVRGSCSCEVVPSSAVTPMGFVFGEKSWGRVGSGNLRTNSPKGVRSGVLHLLHISKGMCLRRDKALSCTGTAADLGPRLSSPQKAHTNSMRTIGGGAVPRLGFSRGGTIPHLLGISWVLGW
eukprot:CAMPEP_0174292526 /NCGR_PEP_ID=MMETSP0809-20121228/35742_1 /TAXON_ID=73025 ORGANISM="Eutreptiella gymnastica-like, Strain CCMP1594" /NCGR_SAMPLE_ID=MMETSP0809 /ASSEMBLY_ACC=CAM_ASM_000658 /LENGTH=142 /DNA_ID=CAMNT_0015392655 /DNA_START=495 /DNA_END=923 /DNA_ORIENTATION=+